jgi:cytochrome P450
MHCGTNPRLWNSHKPLDKFWAQRFIVYPDDKQSGPWSKAKRAQLEPNEKDINIREPRFKLTGMSGAWMPYGAGEHMCPGRFLAKQEIIGGSAIFLANYEVNLLVHDGWVPTPDMTKFGTGAIPPTDKVPVRIRPHALV